MTVAAPAVFVADTGPLLCHGTLKNGARRFRSAVGEFVHVEAVRIELERHARPGNQRRFLREAAAAWVGQHVGRLGTLHDLSASQQEVAAVAADLETHDRAQGKAARHADANAGEAAAIVAAEELRACLVANDNGARVVARRRGVPHLWTTVDVLLVEIELGTTTETSAFDDYQRMIKRDTDPGEALRGPLDFVRRRRPTQ